MLLGRTTECIYLQACVFVHTYTIQHSVSVYVENVLQKPKYSHFVHIYTYISIYFSSMNRRRY